jgi:preprotein translocase subunit SecB
MALTGDSEYAFAPEEGKVLIRLSLESERDGPSGLPYRFQATVAGRFSLREEVPEDQRSRMVYINGSAILYGIARGAVATATALGPYGPVHLPTVNFVDLLERQPARRKGARPRRKTPQQAPRRED